MTLSDKSVWHMSPQPLIRERFYSAKDVKESIKELMYLNVGGKDPEDCSCCKAWLEEIENIFGDALCTKDEVKE